MATYFDLFNFSDPKRVRGDRVADLSNLGQDAFSKPVPQLSPYSQEFSVRWIGAIRPTRTGTYTIHANVASTDERVKIRIGSVSVIDSFSNLAATQLSGILLCRHIFEQNLSRLFAWGCIALR